jgi:hypothetical protein
VLVLVALGAGPAVHAQPELRGSRTGTLTINYWSTAPDDRVRRAHEEEFFQKQNQALISAMKQKLAAEEAARSLAESTGITDAALLERLAGFGFDAETAAVLHLVPMVQVAWADDVVSPAERIRKLK